MYNLIVREIKNPDHIILEVDEDGTSVYGNLKDFNLYKKFCDCYFGALYERYLEYCINEDIIDPVSFLDYINEYLDSGKIKDLTELVWIAEDCETGRQYCFVSLEDCLRKSIEIDSALNGYEVVRVDHVSNN